MIFTSYDLRLAFFQISIVCKNFLLKSHHFRNYATEFQFFSITTCCNQWYSTNNYPIEFLFMKVTVLFDVLRSRFLENKFRNYHKVTHSDRWKGILTCQEFCKLHFVKFFTLETTCWIVYGQITKILTEREIVTITFLATQSNTICFH